MKEFIQGFYGGGALSYFGGVHFYQWEFYAIVVPVILLGVWARN